MDRRDQSEKRICRSSRQYEGGGGIYEGDGQYKGEEEYDGGKGGTINSRQFYKQVHFPNRH